MTDQDGADREATVVGFNADQDVAILQVNGSSWPALHFGRVQRGNQVVVATWRSDTGLATQDGTVTDLLSVTIEDIYVEGTVHRDAFEVHAVNVRFGDSGGAIINDRGEIAGIIYATKRGDPSTVYAVTASAIESLLEKITDDSVDNGRCV